MPAKSKSRRLKARVVPRQKRPRPARSARNGHSPEFLYLTENAKALEAYPGEWLLLHGYGLLAHSKDFGDIKKAIAEHQIQSPFVHYVPTSEEANFIAFV